LLHLDTHKGFNHPDELIGRNGGDNGGVGRLFLSPCAIKGIGLNPQTEFGGIPLWTAQQKSGDPCPTVDTAQHQAGCKGVQGSGMTDFFNIQTPLYP
jgi:hypothetical protein